MSDEYGLTPHSFGAAIALIKGKTVLMHLRDNKPNINYPNHWCIPGGNLKKGETPIEAAKREIKEETSYVSSNPMLFYSGIYTLADGGKHKQYLFCEEYDGKQKLKCLEGQKGEFKSLKEIKKLKVYPDHDKFALKAIEIINSGK